MEIGLRGLGFRGVEGSSSGREKVRQSQQDLGLGQLLQAIRQFQASGFKGLRLTQACVNPLPSQRPGGSTRLQGLGFKTSSEAFLT